MPFVKDWIPDLGLAYILFVALIVVGASNAVNLTDGLDGLAMGPVIVPPSPCAVLAYLAGHARLVGVPLHPEGQGRRRADGLLRGPDGRQLGFLWFNAHPAEVFMGDVGSLALGGAIGTLAVLSKSELLLPFIGGLFVVEAVSVILQVASFR